jgi:hypothetical protein
MPAGGAVGGAAPLSVQPYGGVWRAEPAATVIAAPTAHRLKDG